MQRTTITTFAASAFLAAFIAVSAVAQPGVPGGAGSLLVSGYKQWTRVNPAPHRVYGRFAYQCMSLTPDQKTEEAKSPHYDKFVAVYVNAVGKRAMCSQKTPLFPRGSVIVKEKMATETSRTPELLTVMFKREAGYNPAEGDWEYVVLDGTGTRVKAEGRLFNCQSCHAQWKKNNYVSRQYLPDALRRKLK